MSFFYILLIVSLLCRYGEATVTSVTVSNIMSTSFTISHVVSGTTIPTVTVVPAAGISGTPTLTTTPITGATPCTSYTVTVTEGDSKTVTVLTLPETPGSITVTENTNGLVTATIPAPTTAPTTACPYYMQAVLSTTPAQTYYSTVPNGGIFFYGAQSGSSATITVEYVFGTLFSAKSTQAVTIPTYTDTSTTTAPTTATVGGQYVVTLSGRLYTSATIPAVYSTSFATIGSFGYTKAATGICTSVLDMVKANDELEDAYQTCYVNSFTNGTTIVTLLTEVEIAFTVTKLTTYTNTTLKTKLTSLLTTTQTGHMMFNNAVSPVTISVKGYCTTCAGTMSTATSLLIILCLFITNAKHIFNL